MDKWVLCVYNPNNNEMTSDKHKDIELAYGQFFIDWVNKVYGFDYYVKPNEEEKSSIDVFGYSASKEVLNLQMITSNAETIKLAVQSRNNIKGGLEIKTIDVKGIDWILQAINKKVEINYSNADELILIIQGFMPTPNPKEIEKCIPVTVPFKGIYFVSLPKISFPCEDFETNGYIVAIKSAF